MRINACRKSRGITEQLFPKPAMFFWNFIFAGGRLPTRSVLLTVRSPLFHALISTARKRPKFEHGPIESRQALRLGILHQHAAHVSAKGNASFRSRLQNVLRIFWSSGARHGYYIFIFIEFLPLHEHRRKKYKVLRLAYLSWLVLFLLLIITAFFGKKS